MKYTDQILHVNLNNYFQETALCCTMFYVIFARIVEL